jgi:hypothetical protein
MVCQQQEAPMTANNIAVFGVYPSGVEAERGAADLISAGFPSADISVLLADIRSKRGQSAADGAGRPDVGMGGLLSGALGILTGGSAQVIPGMGPIVAAGPIAARVENLGSAPARGLSALLTEWGLPVENAKSYEGRVVDGGTLLAVRCESPARAKRATQVLHSSGADDVASLQETRPHKAEWALI